MPDENVKDALDRQWRASALAATIGYLGFPLIWMCIEAIIDLPSNKMAILDWSWNFVQSLMGDMFVSIVGIAFIFGIFFWIATFLLTKLTLFAISKSGKRHWVIFVAIGCVEGLILTAIFDWLVFGIPSNPYAAYQFRCIVIAGVLTGAIVGRVMQRTC